MCLCCEYMCGYSACMCTWSLGLMSDIFHIALCHSSSFCCSDKILGPKTLGEDSFFICTWWSVIKGYKCRNLKAGTSPKTMEKYCSLACSLLACSAYFLITSMTAGPGVESPTMVWALYINHSLRKCTTYLPIAQYHGSTFSTERLFSQMALAYVKFTDNWQVCLHGHPEFIEVLRIKFYSNLHT